MTAIGETLRRERLRRNLGLEEISRELKISPKMLEAIEDERFDRLPGGVFAKSFVRQYARLLGLDEEELATEVQRAVQPAGEPSRAPERPHVDVRPIALPRVEEWQAVGDHGINWSSWLPSAALVVVVMMGCAGVYSWWQRTRHPGTTHQTAAAVTPPVRSTAAATAPAEPVQAAPQPQQAPPEPAATGQQQGASPAQTDSRPAGPPPASEQTGPAPAAAQPAQSATATPPPPAGSGPVRVELVAEEPVWILARADGKYSFSGTLEANQTRTLEANSTILLRLGNAGGVNITLNGKPIGTVGPKGQVRTVQLTSGGFEIVAAPKPPAVPLDPLL